HTSVTDSGRTTPNHGKEPFTRPQSGRPLAGEEVCGNGSRQQTRGFSRGRGPQSVLAESVGGRGSLQNPALQAEEGRLGASSDPELPPGQGAFRPSDQIRPGPGRRPRASSPGRAGNRVDSLETQHRRR